MKDLLYNFFISEDQIMKEITKNIYNVGASSHNVDLFESHFVVPNGMAYNSYLIIDEKITLIDGVDELVVDEWLDNIEKVLNGKEINYLVVQHMEPDHSASIFALMKKHPNITVVGGDLTFVMLHNYFRDLELKNKLVIKEGDVLSLGQHSLKFVFAPMVHWPEVFISYELSEKILFSADAFGKFGALDADEEWACEARRYYFGIVGKYGFQVQNLLKKLAGVEVNKICSLHGPILEENLGYYLSLYDTWSKYEGEVDGVFIAYTSVYGHTRAVALEIAEKLKAKGVRVSVSDLARSDMWENVEDAFKYKKIVLATTTYNMSIFPYMNELLTNLEERNYQNRVVGLVENGSWAPQAGRIMKDRLSKMKNMTILEPVVHIMSSKSKANDDEINALVEALSK